MCVFAQKHRKVEIAEGNRRTICECALFACTFLVIIEFNDDGGDSDQAVRMCWVFLAFAIFMGSATGESCVFVT